MKMKSRNKQKYLRSQEMNDQQRTEEINRLLASMESREYAIGALVGSIRRTVRNNWERSEQGSVCKAIGAEISSWENADPLTREEVLRKGGAAGAAALDDTPISERTFNRDGSCASPPPRTPTCSVEGMNVMNTEEMQ